MKITLPYLLVLRALLPHHTWAGPQASPPPACTLVRNAYVLVHRQATPQTEQGFLRAFPATYPAFTAVFGYHGHGTRTTAVQLGCLYETCVPYIDQLFALRHVARAAVFAKVVGIGRHADWQSDGLSYLQEHCITLATTDPVFLAFLDRQPEADIRSFTRFLLLNPVANEPLKKQLSSAYSKYSHLHKALP